MSNSLACSADIDVFLLEFVLDVALNVSDSAVIFLRARQCLSFLEFFLEFRNVLVVFNF